MLGALGLELAAHQSAALKGKSSSANNGLMGSSQKEWASAKASELGGFELAPHSAVKRGGKTSNVIAIMAAATKKMSALGKRGAAIKWARMTDRQRAANIRKMNLGLGTGRAILSTFPHWNL